MKLNITKKIVASACALAVTASGSAGVFANGLPEEGMQNNSRQPQQQEMVTEQNQNQAPMGFDGGQQGGKQQAADAEKSADQKMGDMKGQMPEQKDMSRDAAGNQEQNPEMNPDQMPADGEMGQNPGAPEFEGQPPVGGKSMEGVLSEINSKITGSARDAIDKLLQEYRSAVDTERNATDEESKHTAAGLVKSIADALNAALEKAGLSARIGVPEDKPELPSEDKGSTPAVNAEATAAQKM